MAEPLYKGYSSVVNTRIDTSIFDIECIKQDLLNQFNTRRGERVGRPFFGSIIWDLLFDLSDTLTEGLILEDARRIISEEPRVDLLELVSTISREKHSIRLDIKVNAKEIDMETWFDVTFSQNS